MCFVVKQNIKRFRQMLQGESDPEQRSVIEELLAQESEKLTEDRRTGST